MDEEAAEEGASARVRHIKKRALKNKSLSVSFDEKSLKDYVTGFHKRKRKRRKEALQNQEKAERLRRIELRKKRKLEIDFALYGGALPNLGTDMDKPEEEPDDEYGSEPVASVSGITTYDNEDMHITVTTSSILKEDNITIDRPDSGRFPLVESFEDRKQRKPPIKKKQMKKAPNKRSHPRPLSKRDKKKGKRINKL